MDYRWWLFLHVGSVLVFMLAHGVQVMVTWKKRWQSDPEENLALFEPLPEVRWLRYSGLAVVGSVAAVGAGVRSGGGLEETVSCAEVTGNCTNWPCRFDFVLTSTLKLTVPAA